MKKKLLFLPAIVFSILFSACNSAKSEYDVPNKENQKLAFLFNEEIGNEIQKYAYKMSQTEEFDSLAKASTIELQKQFYQDMSKKFDNAIFESPYIREAKTNTQNFFNSIVAIESYARYGVMSQRVHNQLELNITFENGSKATKVYTGQSLNGLMGPNVLLKILMKNGKVTQAFSNGLELNNPPDWVKNDIITIVKSTMSFDITRNHNKYFKAQKTKDDVKEEWNKVGEN